MTDIQPMLDLADSFDEAVGLYRKMPDGRMVEIHMKKIAMIQSALRAHGDVEQATNLIHDLLGLEPGSSERAMAYLESREGEPNPVARRIPGVPGYGGPLK